MTSVENHAWSHASQCDAIIVTAGGASLAMPICCCPGALAPPPSLNRARGPYDFRRTPAPRAGALVSARSSSLVGALSLLFGVSPSPAFSPSGRRVDVDDGDALRCR